MSAPVTFNICPRCLGDGCEWCHGDGRIKVDPDDIKSQKHCAVCGWGHSLTREEGCVAGDCAMRPIPATFYDPDRANRENFPGGLRRCQTCGAPENDHPYRHPFTYRHPGFTS